MFKSQLCLPVFFYKKGKGTHGFEPWAYRTAADCSTTELYPHKITGVDLYTTTLIQLPGEKKKLLLHAVTRIRTWVTAATTQGPNH